MMKMLAGLVRRAAVRVGNVVRGIEEMATPASPPGERVVRTRAELRACLNDVTFAPSVVNLDRMDLRWDDEAITVDGGREAWRIRFSFVRHDTVTGQPGRGYGRWEIVDPGSTETRVALTCWVLLEMLVRHELMEAFHFRGAHLFNPHKSAADLAWPERLEERP